MRTCFAFFIALGAAWTLSAQSVAPSDPEQSQALSGPLTNGVTRILSDNGCELYVKLKTYIYRGNVRVDNPQMKLTCELLTIDAPEVEDGKFNRAVAETNVVIDWVDENGTNHATAKKAVYTYVITNLAKLPEKQYQTNSTVILTGNPVVVGSRGTMRWDPIVWDRIRDVIFTTNVTETVVNENGSLFNEGAKTKTNSPAKTNSLPK